MEDELMKLCADTKVEYNEKYQTGKEDGFIILDKKKVPVDKLFKTYEKALKYIQKHGELMDITESVPLPVIVDEISEVEFLIRRCNRYTVAMFFAFLGCGEGYGAGSMTLMDGDKQKYYEYEIISVDEPEDESVNGERVDPEFGMESGSLFTEMRKDKTGFYAVKYEEGMEDGWSIFSGDSRPVLIFKTKEEAMTYVRSDKCNYVQIAIPTFWIKEISEEDHQKKRKYCDEFADDFTIRHNNKWYEGEFITEPWDAYIFNNHGDIKIMSKKSLLRLMDECNINIEIRE